MSEENNLPPSEADQVAILSARTPGHVLDWRNEDTARRTYSSNSEFAEVVPDNAFEGADMPSEKRQAAVTELRAMLADTGLSPMEARQLLNRSAHVRADGKSAEQQTKESREALRRKYGDSADSALADMRKLVQRDPRFSKFLERKGLGNDPETVLLLAAAARSQRNRGRLK